MSSAQVLEVSFYALASLFALWGVHWHLEALRLIREQLEKAILLSNDRHVEYGTVNRFRYRYRLLEVASVVTNNVLGIVLVLTIPQLPVRHGLLWWQGLLTLLYTLQLLTNLLALMSFSGILSFMDVRLWLGRPAQLRKLPYRHPSQWFVRWTR